VNPDLPHYKQVRAFHLVEDAFTIESGLLTANGKLKRDLIAERFRNEIDAMYQATKNQRRTRRHDGMNDFKGQTLSWQIVNGAIELALHRDPCNEIGSLTLEELEKFAAALPGLANEAHALIIHSTLKAGFSAGADLRELFQRGQANGKGGSPARGAGVSGAHSRRDERARCCAADDDCGGAWRDVWRRV
jgi:hypothetical protein